MSVRTSDLVICAGREALGVRLSALVLLGSMLACLVPVAMASDAGLASGLEKLKSSSFKTKQEAVDLIAASGADAAPAVLGALVDGRLYVHRAKDSIVIASSTGEFEIVDAATGISLGTAAKSELKRVIANNKMRSRLRVALARLNLSSRDPTARYDAVKSLLGDLSDPIAALMRDALVQEGDRRVQKVLRTALALMDLDSPDRAKRLTATEVLSGSTHAEARTRLVAVAEGSLGDEHGVGRDQELHDATVSALDAIDSKRAMYQVAQTTFFGISLGLVLVLAATGLAITFGVMGVINMAHGELMMLGAYATWVVQECLPDYPQGFLIAAIPVAFLTAGLTGVAIERGVVQFLYGRPLETLLATFGVSLLLQQSVRTIFSPLNRAVSTPDWMSGQLVINDYLALTYNRLYIIVFSLAAFLTLVGILRHTTLGLQIRAVSQNRDMARAMGVRSSWIDAATFGLGSGVAGLAGVALTQLTNVGPNLGQTFIVDCFMVVVFGGVGNLWGTFVAGLTLGIGNKFIEPFVGAVLAKVIVLVFIVLFIQKRPRGLFPEHGRAAEA